MIIKVGARYRQIYLDNILIKKQCITLKTKNYDFKLLSFHPNCDCSNRGILLLYD